MPKTKDLGFKSHGVYAVTQQLLHGARLCSTAPSVSHLFFADDSIIFGRAHFQEVDLIKHILTIYEAASGQKVNLEKSSITFSKKIPREVTLELSARLGVRHADSHGTYLGIPSTIGRSKREIFQMLEDRVRKKSKDWKRRFLSAAGKSILIKTILQAIPVYLMSCFLIPEHVCKRLNSLSAQFFWGQRHEERRIHWRNWKSLCRAKWDGGLGFRDISCFNRALLAKQAWRLISKPDSPLAQSLKARYYPRMDITQVTKAYNPSYTWRSLVTGLDILRDELAWRVGNGLSIRVGLDRWIPSSGGFKPGRALDDDTANTKAADFILFDRGTWDMDKLGQVFSNFEVEKIASIPIRLSPTPDSRFWPHTKSGTYTVKSGYATALSKAREEATSSGPLHPIWKWLWKLNITPKVRLFMWKCLEDALPLRCALRRRGLDLDPTCARCGESDETIEHVFRDCAWTTFFWRSSSLRLSIEQADRELCFLAWISQIQLVDNADFHRIFCTFLWVIWYARNLLIFQHKELSHLDCFNLGMKHLPLSLPHRSLPKMQDQSLDVVPGFWRVWCDAAFKPDIGVGLGVFITDDNGILMGCCYKFLHSSVDAEIGECLAIREGVLLAKRLRGRAIIIKTDCQSAFCRLSCSESDLSITGGVIHDIKALTKEFDKVKFSWTRRCENSVADQLAKFALHHCSSCDLVSTLPSFVRSSPSGAVSI
ncbi:uncharacterized protein LOC131009970 [Salvia miltiorrhiza]|uniref:uncharacterized protein LOC131009970 n=1 Tax=Salvia miltiorrhiza TaxID=226208 RepID=UPI0025ABA3A1|nr:uncharacterized protein LOC131009970 [Salvia miltiorrhiza]